MATGVRGGVQPQRCATLIAWRSGTPTQKMLVGDVHDGAAAMRPIKLGVAQVEPHVSGLRSELGIV